MVSSYLGSWQGPKADGASDFATVEIVVIFVIVLVLVALVAVAAAWKSKLVEHAIERFFETLGRFIGKHPVKVASIAFILGIAISGGMSMQENEVDPSRLWVPSGSLSLDHSQYVKDTWPSGRAPTFIIALPKSGETGSNILTAANLRSMLDVHNKVMAIEIDGDEIVETSKEIADYSSQYGGKWTFDGLGSTKAKCAKFGSSCAMQSILGVFGYNQSSIISDAQVLDSLALWDRAPRDSFIPQLGVYKSFELADVLGGISRDGSARVVSAEVFMWFMFLVDDQQQVKFRIGDETVEGISDPIVDSWEAETVCILSVQEKHPVKKGTKCPQPSGGLKYTGLFQRSFGDEFGSAVRGDISKLSIAYLLIIVYLFFNLGKRDVVHSMLMMSIICIVCVGLSFSGASGLAALFGVKNNPLNNNVPFLLLGLGVDDAFVLVAELVRHMTQNAGAEAVDLIALTAKTGGASIMITSITDALAFIVGSSTSLPALSAFCIYAGVGVLLCFFFQIFLFLPLLALNVQRTKANRFDMLCCFKSKHDHPVDDPKGCCCCLCVPQCNPKDGLVNRALGKVGSITVKTPAGKIASVLIWLIVFCVGVVGCAMITKDFKLEWFFPEGSYTKDFIGLNDQYFSQGTDFCVYLSEVDVFAKKHQLDQLTSYIHQQSSIKTSSIQNWWEKFRPTAASPVANTASLFYNDIYTWLNVAPEYRSSIIWVDSGCNSITNASCDPTRGIAHSKIAASLKRLGSGTERFETVNGMRKDLLNIFGEGAGKMVFPFSNNFLYWEENGVIDSELTRNLVIAAGIVFMIICVLIPRPRIALIVSLGICMSIVEIVGYMHWWGLTINGTTTINILICLGLSVDYSAHIAHIFKESVGKADDRAVAAMTRIGPSVFHAIFSTLLAVIVLASSNSYVFVSFFKILFLVTIIAGFKGLWLLPVVLSLLGGDQEEQSAVPRCQEVAEVVKPGISDGVRVGGEPSTGHLGAI